MWLHPETLSNIEALLEADETLQHYSAWFFANDFGQRVDTILAMTETRLYHVMFTPTRKAVRLKAGYPVATFTARPFNMITRWQIDNAKATTGAHIGFGFQLGDASGNWWHLEADLHAASFVEAFEVAMRRDSFAATLPNVGEHLRQLQLLTQDGILSAEEFTRAKEMMFGKPADAVAQAERSLRSLHQLRMGGILSEPEFAAKKWDILAGTQA